MLRLLLLAALLAPLVAACGDSKTAGSSMKVTAQVLPPPPPPASCAQKPGETLRQAAARCNSEQDLAHFSVEKINGRDVLVIIY